MKEASKVKQTNKIYMYMYYTAIRYTCAVYNESMQHKSCVQCTRAILAML